MSRLYIKCKNGTYFIDGDDASYESLPGTILHIKSVPENYIKMLRSPYSPVLNDSSILLSDPIGLRLGLKLWMDGAFYPLGGENNNPHFFLSGNVYIAHENGGLCISNYDLEYKYTTYFNNLFYQFDMKLKIVFEDGYVYEKIIYGFESYLRYIKSQGAYRYWKDTDDPVHPTGYVMSFNEYTRIPQEDLAIINSHLSMYGYYKVYINDKFFIDGDGYHGIGFSLKEFYYLYCFNVRCA